MNELLSELCIQEAFRCLRDAIPKYNRKLVISVEDARSSGIDITNALELLADSLSVTTLYGINVIVDIKTYRKKQTIKKLRELR